MKYISLLERPEGFLASSSAVLEMSVTNFSLAREFPKFPRRRRGKFRDDGGTAGTVLLRKNIIASTPAGDYTTLITVRYRERRKPEISD